MQPQSEILQPQADQRPIGVLLTNLGTPDAPTPKALRRYLSEFLWDPRVVDIPRFLWWVLLHGVILRTRPRRSARAYQKIWTEQGPPLLSISRRQRELLQAALTRCFVSPITVVLGMRYGQPSIVSAFERLHKARADRVLVLPLYPQYSSVTTASTFDAVAEVLRKWRWMPELHMITHYYDEAGYIQALVNSIRDTWDVHQPPEKLLFSYHGMPKRYQLEGDPYYDECLATTRLVAAALGLPEDRWQLAFQSRFGREEWLQPYADQILRQWGEAGVRSVHVICPGFSADGLETLGEIAVTNRDTFLEAGGQSYHSIPCLNDRADHIQMLAALVKRCFIYEGKP